MNKLEKREARMRQPVPAWAAEAGLVVFFAACLWFGYGLAV